MAFLTRSAVRALTLSEPLMVRDTVAVETLACFATSLIFISSIHRLPRDCGYSVRFGSDLLVAQFPPEWCSSLVCARNCPEDVNATTIARVLKAPVKAYLNVVGSSCYPNGPKIVQNARREILLVAQVDL
jgi:hypothetical protein